VVFGVETDSGSARVGTIATAAQIFTMNQVAGQQESICSGSAAEP
jgi:hypothetical protein